MDAGSYGKTKGGFYAFEHGHVALWTTRSNPEDEPLYERRQQLIDQYGQAKADWMIGMARNLCLYPNVYLMDQFSSQIRQYRPVSVDQTEVTIHCVAPKGESARPGPPASAGTRTSSTPRGWPPPTTSRSSGPPSVASSPRTPRGTT